MKMHLLQVPISGQLGHYGGEASCLADSGHWAGILETAHTTHCQSGQRQLYLMWSLIMEGTKVILWRGLPTKITCMWIFNIFQVLYKGLFQNNKKNQGGVGEGFLM